MRTNLEIDDKLMRQAMSASGKTTKKAAVEEALQLVVQLKKQERIRRWFGRIAWEGDLDAMRQSRTLEWEEEKARATVGENRHGDRVFRESTQSR